MSGSEPTRVDLRRDGPNQPWGFRLQGGIDFPTPLSIQSVSIINWTMGVNEAAILYIG